VEPYAYAGLAGVALLAGLIALRVVRDERAMRRLRA
jgi:hypothetical protein